MTAGEWYRGRAATWSVARDRETRAATLHSRLRVLTFAAAIGLGGWGLPSRPPRSSSS